MFTRLRSLILSGTAFLVLSVATPAASAQDRTWTGGLSANGNVSGAANWLEGAPASDNDYQFIFNPVNLTNTSRTTAVWNVANVGFLSLSLAGSETVSGFTLSGTTSIALKGGITVTSGQHTFNTTATVANDATWNIAAGSSVTRATTDTLSIAADRKITKTGAGTLVFQSSNAGILGTLEVQQGVLRVRTSANTLGSATLALNGGVFEIFSNGPLTNANTTTTVIGESTVRLARDSAGAGQSHVMGALQLGSSQLTVTANDQNTSGTASVTFGATTLSNNATLEVVNGTAAATRVTLGAVGETGGLYGLTKTGNGQLLLAASNSYSGNTVVSAGSLILGAAGSILGSLDVASGATLRGGGTIFGDTTLHGVLAPGTLDAGGTITMTGSLNAPGTVRFRVYGNGINDRLLVSGAVDLGGTVVVTVGDGAYTPASGDSFDLLDGTISGSPVLDLPALDGGLTWVTNSFASTGVLSITNGGEPAGDYTNWLTNYPSLTGPDALGSADPDGDGFSNNLEYAFDGNPTVGSPALLSVRRSGADAVFSFVARKDPPGGVTYIVQSATNLTTGPWIESGITPTIATDQGGVLIPTDYERREFTVPASGKSFFRVRATIND